MMLCLVCGERPILARFRCPRCYARAVRLGLIAVVPHRPSGPCAVAGCERTDRGGRGYCRMHYMRQYRYGDPLVIRKRRREERGESVVEDEDIRKEER